MVGLTKVCQNGSTNGIQATKNKDKIYTNGSTNGKINGTANGSACDDNNYLEMVSDEVLAKEGILEHVEAKQDYKWGNIVFLTTLHLCFLYALFTFPFLTRPHCWSFLFGKLKNIL